jgi:hypothetical protein
MLPKRNHAPGMGCEDAIRRTSARYSCATVSGQAARAYSRDAPALFLSALRSHVRESGVVPDRARERLWARATVGHRISDRNRITEARRADHSRAGSARTKDLTKQAHPNQRGIKIDGSPSGQQAQCASMGPTVHRTDSLRGSRSPPTERSTMRPRIVLHAILIGLIPTTASCSFLFVSGPPSAHDRLPYFTCTQSNTVPVLDAIWAGLNGLGAVLYLTAEEGTEEHVIRSEGIAVGAAWFVVSGLSARSGFRRTDQCRAATMQLIQRQAARDTTSNMNWFDLTHPGRRQ